MTKIASVLATILIAVQAGMATARADDTVGVALVLTANVSQAIGDKEFALQKKGYAAAFRDKQVVDAIRSTEGGLAVSYVEFSGPGEAQTVVGWTIVRDGAAAASFADRLDTAPRSFSGKSAIGDGIDFAVRSFDQLGVKAEQRIVDLSADSLNDSGRNVAVARDAAIAAGVRINSLVILNDHPEGLMEYFGRNVTGGKESFVMEIHELGGFAYAMLLTLAMEVGRVWLHVQP